MNPMTAMACAYGAIWPGRRPRNNFAEISPPHGRPEAQERALYQRKKPTRRGVMRTLTPPLAPKLTDGRAYVETDEAEADEWTVVSNIMDGQYSNPARVVAFNIAEGWSCDVTESIAHVCLREDAAKITLVKLQRNLSRGLLAK
jgi:hypothetical protein